MINLIYPNTCGMCEKISKENICKKCEIKIKQYEINLFKKYKKDSGIFFEESIHMYRYDGIIRQKIIEYKFQDKAYLYKTFSKIIIKNEKICDNLKKYDIIIPVPIHKKRKQFRGYNQTELISKAIAKHTGLKLEKNILVKQKNIVSQSELSKIQRKENIKNAFIIKKAEKVNNKKILIFDDIYTTGSTVNECSKMLKQAGAEIVGVVTFAKD
ncbi:MAG: ComF family protein [Clostridia bacterium]|nr:ComF family protein [Clostridia bacterium]